MLERQHYLNTSQLIMDILKAIRDGQSKQGIERSVIEEKSTNRSYISSRILASFVGMVLFMDCAQEFFDFTDHNL